MTHRIASVTFIPRTNHGPLTCSCGEQMDSDEFYTHRQSLGLRTNGNLRVPDDIRQDPSVWTTISMCKTPNCRRKLHAKGYCEAHYRRQQRGSRVGPDEQVRPYA